MPYSYQSAVLVTSLLVVIVLVCRLHIILLSFLIVLIDSLQLTSHFQGLKCDILSMGDVIAMSDVTNTQKSKHQPQLHLKHNGSSLSVTLGLSSEY